MLEERKLVTVIFVDIVGSTALVGKHDPEVVRATLGRAFSAMSKILQAHGGTVEKFIGDAVMAVFGVPMAHDDDADRAVRAAFAIGDRLADLNLRGGLPDRHREQRGTDALERRPGRNPRRCAYPGNSAFRAS